MKKIILAIAVVFLAMFSQAGSPEFMKVMGETLGQYQYCKNVEDFQSLANKFERIANAEKGEWLPLYYHAHCNILMSFMEPTDAKKKDEYLDAAEKSIEKIIVMAPGEAEVFALQGFLYTGRLVVNPMERGQKYSMLSGQSLGKALAMDPGNPRASILKLQNEMGTAQFYGNDPAQYCSQAFELLARWDNFKPKSPIYPAWGKDQVEQLVEGCKAGK
jgi:hypothetical protein